MNNQWDQPEKTAEHEDRAGENWTKLLEYGCYLVSVLCLLLGLCGSGSKPAEPVLPVREQQKYLIAEYAEELDGLHRWGEAGREERLSMLETVLEIEGRWLQISPPVLFTENIVQNLPERTMQAYYSGGRICIDECFLMNGTRDDVLDTVCHEMFHAWQHAFLNAGLDRKLFGYLAHKADAYREEFKRDQTEISAEEYWFQETEMDARQYALFRLPYYQSVLDLE